MIHEYVGKDHVIDRCLKEGFNDEQTLQVVNMAFSKNTNMDYVKNRRVVIQRYQDQLKQLLEYPKMEQRSEEWYKARKTLITASDFAQALGEGKFASQKQFFQKKCGFEEEGNLDMMSVPPLKWGVMFEPVASYLYEQKTGMKLYEFGLIRHPDRSYFGASPDGITDMGIMVEIKCPYRRKINYEVPTQYYYQIQGQLDVCGLDECDYLECEFSEVSQDEFESLLQGDHDLGVIVEVHKLGGSVTFEYFYVGDQEPDQVKNALEHWMASLTPVGTLVPHFWKLAKYNVMRVYRDDNFIKDKLDELAQIWGKVQDYQQNKSLYDSEVAANKKEKMGGKITGYSFI